jgi:hypothetical protein
MDQIFITVKFYSGIEKELKIDDYDMGKGVVYPVKPGIRLRSLLKNAGLKKLSRFCYFSDGARISSWKKFYESSEVSCLRISGGG